MLEKQVAVIIHGENTGLTTSWVDLWKQNIVRTNPTVAVLLGISSGNAADAIAGTGARTLRVHGLDANWQKQTEDFSTNGQTKVTGTKYFLRVNYVEVLTAGSGGTNAGDIYVYDSSDTVVAGVPQTATKIFHRIDTGMNQGFLGSYSTAFDERLEIRDIHAYVADDTATAKYAKVRMYMQTAGGLLKYYPIGGAGSPAGPNEYEAPLEIPPKTDVVFQMKASAAGGAGTVIATFNFVKGS